MRVTSNHHCHILLAGSQSHVTYILKGGGFYQGLDFRRRKPWRFLRAWHTEFSNDFTNLHSTEFQLALTPFIKNARMQLNEPLTDIREVETYMLNYSKHFCIIGGWDENLLSWFQAQPIMQFFNLDLFLFGRYQVFFFQFWQALKSRIKINWT